MKTCSDCAQQCCKSVIVEIDKPTTLEDWDNIRWKVAHKNVWVIKDFEDDWCIEFFTDCKYLAESGKCEIHHQKPQICTEHDPEECIVNGEGEFYQVILKSITDVDDYLKQHPEAIEEEDAA